MKPVRVVLDRSSNIATEGWSNQPSANNTTMNFPGHYLVTGETDSIDTWWSNFEALLDIDDSFIQFRPAGQYMQNPAQWAKKAIRLARQKGRKIVLNGEPDTAMLLEMDGVHLPSRLLMRLRSRPLAAKCLVGASCHSMAELKHAGQIGVDFVCLSPLFATRSHPGARFLGLEKFQALVSACTVPVFAMGGVDKSDMERVRQAGGYGIAGISAYWGKRMS